MTGCRACGDKPKKSCAFPSAVIEIDNPEQITLLRKVVIPASMGNDEAFPPAIGRYRNVILQYEANDHVYIYSSDGIPTKIEMTVPQEVLDRIATLESETDELDRGLASEADTRERADGVLQQEIDDLKNSPDVVDIVSTYADLMAYDTSDLGDKDVIRVLRDETHSGESSYYRWNTSSQTWTFIGTVGDYYTKQQVDALLGTKQDELTAGENIQIEDESGSLVISSTDTTYTAGYGLNLNGTEFSVDPDIVQDTLTAGDNITIEDESGSLVISATDTTYSAFTGADGTAAGIAGLVPAPAATDNTKYLKGDGTWATVQAGPTVVQTTGTSTTNVMSQNATTAMVYVDPANRTKVQIGGYANTLGNYGVAIGYLAECQSNSTRGIALGTGARAVAQGEMNIGTIGIGNNQGYNNSNYRLISGVYDGQSAHDAATYGQVISYSAINGADAPTTATEGKYVGQLYYDTTNDKMYYLSAIDTTTTPTTYTWETLGGGPAVVQGTGTSTTDVMSQNAVTGMVFADPANRTKVAIGNNTSATGSQSIAIGGWTTSQYSAKAEANGAIAIGGSSEINIGNVDSIAIGNEAKVTGSNAARCIAIGTGAKVSTVNASGAIALGAGASATQKGEMNIGSSSTSYGYNSSNYRLLTGVYDPQSAHDAATKGYVDTSLLAKQDALTAGTGISIADESGALVISATGAQIATINAQDWSALWQ